MPVREGAVENDGVRIHYLDWGPPPGGERVPSLLLVHATGFLGALWRPIAEPLARRFRVVAVDQRGHGDSDKPEEGYAFEAYASDLQRVIEELRLERPVAAGHSSGGTTIAVHAAQHPGVIARAVLVEPILPRPDWFTRPPGGRNPNSLAEGARQRRAVWESRDEAFASYRKKDAFRTWREDVLRLYVDDGMADREDGKVELKCPPEVEGAFFESVTTIDVWSMLPDVRCPALLLWGAESHLRARSLDAGAQEALPDARTVIVPEASHFLPQERPDEVARHIEAFLAD